MRFDSWTEVESVGTESDYISEPTIESKNSDFECDRSNMMGEIRYIKTSEADIELLMQVRLEMLREINDLSDEYVYDERKIVK